ncbi:MAG: hypothetical protein ACLTW7_15940 [Enterococcus sp.]|uniref:hypothetical protein n=1 Tax=Enterococcus sp. TaxID=35783 RepID=UPI0039952D16
MTIRARRKWCRTKVLALRDVNDQTLLDEQIEKVDALNKAFTEDNNSFSSSQAMADTIEKSMVCQGWKEYFNLYRKIYPMVSSQENGFVSISLIGFGQRLV